MLPARSLATPKISFLAFFLLWADRMRWEVPDLHVRVCVWMERAWLSGDPLLLLMLPRGHAKSTILAVFNAWIYYCWPLTRILHQSESNPTAYKTSRDTQNVLRHHPLTRGMLPDGLGTVESWWVNGAMENDSRNPSMYARGILSNVTSARADFIQNDDVEVPGNIGTPENREKMRYRLGEQTHIAVPGAPKMYIGTPHTHDSLYEDIKKLGANALIVRMFSKEHRIEKATDRRYSLPFAPQFVFSGIGKGARLLSNGVDYSLEGTVLVLHNPAGDLLDCYAEPAWPERFGAEELENRRRETRTINEWDSQYQLHAKPIAQVRLDPARITPYDVEPRLVQANGAVSMFLGRVQVVGASCRWDPSGGKLKSDASGVAVSLQDATGRRYLHRVTTLTGDVAEFGDDGKTITGGQVWQLCDLVADLNLPRVTIETNGIGGFAPAILRAALKQRRLACGVVEHASTGNKNKRILGTFEPLLLSRGMLWAHVDVLRGPFWQQMRDWKPEVADQPDDLLDAAEGAMSEQPERIKAVGGNGGISRPVGREDWRPEAGVRDVIFER
jgi:hypothetical protein